MKALILMLLKQKSKTQLLLAQLVLLSTNNFFVFKSFIPILLNRDFFITQIFITQILCVIKNPRRQSLREFPNKDFQTRISQQEFSNKIYCILPERKTSIILNGRAVPDFKCSAKKKTASAVPSA